MVASGGPSGGVLLGEHRHIIHNAPVEKLARAIEAPYLGIEPGIGYNPNTVLLLLPSASGPCPG